MKSKEINIQDIDPRNMVQMDELSLKFGQVFTGPPWYEVTKCEATGSFFGPDTQIGSPCPDCQAPLLEAYPKEETIKYILKELGNTNPIGLLAYVNKELAGFSWGYQTTPLKLVESKWKTPEMRQTVQKLLGAYGVKDKLFYGSETGVDPKFRDIGLGRKLVKTRFNEILRTDEKYALVRTNINSPMYGIIKGSWDNKGLDGFTQILGPVAAKSFWTGAWERKNEKNTIMDTENADRVLFLFDRSDYDYIQRQPTPGQLMSAGW